MHWWHTRGTETCKYMFFCAFLTDKPLAFSRSSLHQTAGGQSGTFPSCHTGLEIAIAHRSWSKEQERLNLLTEEQWEMKTLLCGLSSWNTFTWCRTLLSSKWKTVADLHGNESGWFCNSCCWQLQSSAMLEVDITKAKGDCVTGAVSCFGSKISLLLQQQNTH